MKKSFTLWIRISNRVYEVLYLLLFLFLLLVLPTFLTPIYEKGINSFKQIGTINMKYFVIGIVFVVMVSSLVEMARKAVETNIELKYALHLKRNEYFIFLLLRKISWYYLYMLIWQTIVSGTILKRLILACIYTSVYLGITYIAYEVSCDWLYKGAGNNRVKKVKPDKKRIKFIWSRKHRILELIHFGVLSRYNHFGLCLCKIIIVVFGIVLGRIPLEGNLLLIILLILNMILIVSNDVYWKDEKDNMFYFSLLGISHKKYIGINFISGVLFNELLLGIIFYVCSWDLRGLMVLVLVGSFCLFYWNTVYLYINMCISGDGDILKDVINFIFLFINFIPIVNILMILFLLRKIRLYWREK